jgi:carbohydrate-selective porin OprB
MRIYTQVLRRALFIAISVILGGFIKPGLADELTPASLSQYKASTQATAIGSNTSLSEEWRNFDAPLSEPTSLSDRFSEDTSTKFFGDPVQIQSLQTFEQPIDSNPEQLVNNSPETSQQGIDTSQTIAIAPSPDISSSNFTLPPPPLDSSPVNWQFRDPVKVSQVHIDELTTLQLNLPETTFDPSPPLQGVLIGQKSEATEANPPLEPSEEYLPNPFGLKIPKKRDPYDFSHKKHCDVIRHLKVPATTRRLDSYMRPEYMLRRPQTDSILDQDQLLAFPGREELYKQGVDVYGCSSTDFLTDIIGNLSDNPRVRGTGPWHSWQLNLNQVVGVDFYSRLVSKKWKGGQIHLSGVYAEAGNKGPIYSYGNTLNPAGLGTRQYLGYFYTDIGRSRDVNSSMQGIRLFEYWFQQAYGYKNQSYIRIGTINPWITFNKSILAGLFGFWAFDEPGVIGTTPGTANGPVITTAPPGLSVEHAVGDHFVVKGMVASGYWDPTGGVDNRRGVKQFWDLKKYGLEFFYEATYKGGTYSLNPKDNGKPWFVRAGGQYHTGYGLSNLFDVDGNFFFLTGRPRQVYYGNSQYYAMFEAMPYRKKGTYDQGLTTFIKLKWSPWDYRGSSTRNVTVAMAYEGLFGRKDDVLFLGYSHIMFNKGVYQRSESQLECTEVPGCKVSRFQGVFELGYSAQITKYLWLNPKLFYILYPNIRKDLGNTLSFATELRISF